MFILCWGEHISSDKSSLKKENILKCIQGMRKLGAKAITFTKHGEPMIHKDFYEIGTSKKLGFDCGLITNGSVITEKNAELLPDTFNWLRISILEEIRIKILKYKEKIILN